MQLPASDAEFAARRERMVDSQLRARGIHDSRVLDAMRRVPRHRFVPPDQRDLAYGDHPVAIGFSQTISQPFIVAYMTEALALEPGARVLEIGTGSAYQTAVLAEIAGDVYSIEVVPEIAERAATLLGDLGYSHVHLRRGDGYNGWPEAAPFDGIIVTAAPDHIPEPSRSAAAIRTCSCSRAPRRAYGRSSGSACASFRSCDRAVPGTSAEVAKLATLQGLAPSVRSPCQTRDDGGVGLKSQNLRLYRAWPPQYAVVARPGATGVSA
jgi:protein-L-isoaspartate(D-aspartate) O-methyltransferase